MLLYFSLKKKIDIIIGNYKDDKNMNVKWLEKLSLIQKLRKRVPIK